LKHPENLRNCLKLYLIDLEGARGDNASGDGRSEIEFLPIFYQLLTSSFGLPSSLLAAGKGLPTFSLQVILI